MDEKMKLCCDDCGAVFDEEDARYVMAREEDHAPRGTLVLACPACKSTSVFDASEFGLCIRCGQPTADGSDYCEHCRGDLWG